MLRTLLLAPFFMISLALAQEVGDCVSSDQSVIDRDVNKLASGMCLFEKPLIVGASVSEGYMANPGGMASLVAQKLNPSSTPTIIAHANHTSVESLKMGKEGIPYDALEVTPSVVVGIDLFFWDAANEKCGTLFEHHTRKFFKFYEKTKTPLIIGKLPKGVSFPSGYQKITHSSCTDKINRLIDKLCTIQNNCVQYDPKECFDHLQKEAMEKFGEGKEKERKVYLESKLKSFYVDDLHPTKLGNEYCSTVFIKNQNVKSLQCLAK